MNNEQKTVVIIVGMILFFITSLVLMGTLYNFYKPAQTKEERRADAYYACIRIKESNRENLTDCDNIK